MTNPLLDKKIAEFDKHFGGSVHGWHDGIITIGEVEAFLAQALAEAYEAGRENLMHELDITKFGNYKEIKTLRTQARHETAREILLEIKSLKRPGPTLENIKEAGTEASQIVEMWNETIDDIYTLILSKYLNLEPEHSPKKEA